MEEEWYEMKAEVQIQALYDCYPKLYQVRDEVLNFLFLIPENGFYWVNGELVEKLEPIARAKNKLKNQKAYQYFLINEYDRALLRDLPRKHRWSINYATSSYISHYPKNIKKDWLKLLNECKTMIVEDGLDLLEPSEEDIELYRRIHREGGGPLYASGR